MDSVKCHGDESCLAAYTDMGDVQGLCSRPCQAKVYS